MNRFDPAYHEIDPATRRPFSAGHPDGVWMIAIVYGLITLAALVRVAVEIKIRKATGLPVELLTSAAVALVAYIPPIVLLFTRNALAVVWTTLVTVGSAVGAVFIGMQMLQQNTLGWPEIGALLAAVGFHAYIAIYTYLLKADSILT